jgi:iron(III) transport system ATP-binding protein
MADLSLVNVSKTFGAVRAVENLTLEVKYREFVTLLGPSGCGTTTTLRMIAGFVQPDEGEIRAGDLTIASPARGICLPPEARRMAMVFQNYALWPHMTVLGNTMFGLQTRGVASRLARSKAMDALHLVRMDSMGERYPHELSGGQQQRVSLARAIACEPSILLMDEPLSNLDAKLRETMRLEIKDLHRKLGVTSIYVTHDQSEAIVISDRVCMMWQGRILQSAPPSEIYQRPACRQVAEFIGQTNFLSGTVTGAAADGLTVETQWGSLRIAHISRDVSPGQVVTISARPEAIRLHRSDGSAAPHGLRGRISSRVYLGNLQEYWVDLSDKMVRVQAPVTEGFREGDLVALDFDPQRMAVVEGGT